MSFKVSAASLPQNQLDFYKRKVLFNTLHAFKFPAVMYFAYFFALFIYNLFMSV